jgi:hypothetical protein
LNRLVSKRQDDPTSGALIADFLYDAVGQKGLLSKSRSYTVEGVVEVQNLAYDMRNRPTQQQWVAPGAGGGTFRMDASFDEADQKTSLSYPGGNAGQSGEVVSYQYNAVGQLVNVSGLGGIQYVSSASHNAQGQLTQLVNENGNGSNGLTRQWVYETNTLRLSVVRAGTSAPFESLQKLSCGYDNAGNPSASSGQAITSLTDGTNRASVIVWATG